MTLSQGSVRIQSRYVRMTPYSAAAGGSFSSRESSRVGRLARPPRAAPARRALAQLVRPPPARSSPSPSSSWIAFSCWRRKNSRWPFSISDCTCDWIFEPSSSTSSSRLRIARDLPQPLLDVRALEQLLLLLGLQAQGRGDEVAERARVVDVRGGELQLLGQVRDQPDDAREQGLDVARQRLDLARLLDDVGHVGELADEVRLLLDAPVEPDAAHALDEDRAASRRGPGSSCARSPPCRPRTGRPSPAASTSSLRTVTSASMRSPETTSSTSLIERSWPIASGVIEPREDDRLLQRQHGQGRREPRCRRARLDGLVARTRSSVVLTTIDHALGRGAGCGASGSTIVRMAALVGRARRRRGRRPRRARSAAGTARSRAPSAGNLAAVACGRRRSPRRSACASRRDELDVVGVDARQLDDDRQLRRIVGSERVDLRPEAARRGEAWARCQSSAKSSSELAANELRRCPRRHARSRTARSAGLHVASRR